MNGYDLETIGSFIAERRKKFGYTQNQLAVLLNTSFKTVSKWETGNNFPDLSYQVDLCNLLKISLDELHTGKLNKKRRLRRSIIISSLSILIFLIVLLLQNYFPTLT